jgi:hypothetical protein
MLGPNLALSSQTAIDSHSMGESQELSMSVGIDPFSHACCYARKLPTLHAELQMHTSSFNHYRVKTNG